tara:strand:- start:315 stop:599 length:285 start_codon:yes stop_codon:yes gene_type:complete
MERDELDFLTMFLALEEEIIDVNMMEQDGENIDDIPLFSEDVLLEDVNGEKSYSWRKRRDVCMRRMRIWINELENPSDRLELHERREQLTAHLT